MLSGGERGPLSVAGGDELVLTQQACEGECEILGERAKGGSEGERGRGR